MLHGANGALPFNAMRTTPPPPPYTDTVGLNTMDYVAVESHDGHVFVVHRDCVCEAPLIRRAFAKRTNVHHRDVVIEFDGHNGHDASGNRTAARMRHHNGSDDGSDDPDDDGNASMTGLSTAAPTLTIVNNDDEDDGGSSERGARGQSVATTTTTAAHHGTTARSSRANSATSNATSTLHARSATLAGSYNSSTAAADVAAAASLLSRQQQQQRDGGGGGDALHVDDTVRLHFPRTRAATLETVLAYLYYKRRYEGVRGDDVPQRPQPQQRPPFDVPVGCALELMQLAAVLEC